MALTKINSNLISNNTVANTNIADNAVDATKIASNSILTRHIDDAQITTDQILDGTIATADIADDAVTEDKLANAINTSIAAKLPLAGGTMTGALAGTAATFSGNITFGDGHTIGNDGDDNLAITGSANENIIIDSADDIILDADGGDVIFRDGGVEKMRLDAGDLGIGTASPNTKFQVNDGTNLNINIGSLGSVASVYSMNDAGNAYAAMRIDAAGTGLALNSYSGGNVGIGIATPASKLHIKTSTNHNLEFEEASGDLRISALNDARDTNEVLQFAASEFNFLTGNVGIGTTAPDNLLTVKGAAHAGINIRAGDGYNATLAFSDASGAWYESFIRYRTDTNTMAFDVAGGEKMSITSAGKVLIGTAEAATVGKAIVMAMVFG